MVESVMKINRYLWNSLDQNGREKILSRSRNDISAVLPDVQKIIDEIRRTGDEALRRFTKEWDHVDLTGIPLKVTPEEREAAEASLPDELKTALDFSIENVRRFHERQKPEGITPFEISSGIFGGEKVTPIESLGIYIPRGRGSFPSMLYMTAVPAVVAGVPRICVVTPPAADGSVDAACLYAAKRCGIDEIYRVGGAQAIAALAYGTESIPPVVKLTGPGSRYVTAAKQLLYGTVDVGLPAGPSESIILADAAADPYTTALDLITEAEHGSDSSALLITPSAALADAVESELPGLIAQLPEQRREFVTNVLSGYGGIIQTASIEEAVDLVNRLATEHLKIVTENPFETEKSIRNAGEIILGERTPFSSANYSIGPNAVLPTGGSAKTFSGVSVRDFVKYSSLIYTTEDGYNRLREVVPPLAEYEGFSAHKNAFDLRKGN